MKQEETRQAEIAAKATEYKAMQAQAETVRYYFNLSSGNIILFQFV